MKTKFFLIAGLAALLAASCTEAELQTPVATGEEVTVSFTASVPSEIATKAYSDGLTARELTYAVYENGAATIDPLIEGEATFAEGSLSTTVEMSLVTGKTYDIIFWAQAEKNETYTVNFDTQEMTVDYSKMNANDENNDAFYALVERLQVKAAVNENVDLYRPFAQINLGTNDYVAAKKAGLEVSKTRMVATVANKLNLMTGAVSGQEEVTFAANAIPTVTIDVENNTVECTENFPVEGYEYLCMNYVLVNEKTTTNCTFYVTDKQNNTELDPALSISNVPVQRNYRTNIYGALLTEPANFNVTIVPEYTTPDFDVPADVAAIYAAAKNGGKITLENDVVLPEVLKVEKELTINLNGKELSYASADPKNHDTYAMIRVNGGSLTVEGEGEMASNAYVFIVDNGAVLNLNGNNTYSGTTTIAQVKAGTLNVNAGTFALSGTTTFLLNCTDEAYTDGTAVIKVMGGAFKNFDPANNAAEGANTNFVAEGYKSVEGEDGYYTVSLDNHGSTAEVMTAAGLLEALTAFTTGGAENNTIVLASDIVLADNENWTPIFYSAYTGGAVTIDGNGKSISGLNAPLIAGCTQGNSTDITIKNLTIKDSEMLSMPAGVTTAGNGIFGGAFDATSVLTLENCHAVNCKVVSENYAGMIGYSSATNTSFIGCTVTDCDFEGASVGGVTAMAAGSNNNVKNCVVTNCRFNNIDDKVGYTKKTGYLVSTVNAGTNVFEGNSGNGNTYTLNGVNGGSLTHGIGRFVGGTLTVDGVAQEQFAN